MKISSWCHLLAYRAAPLTARGINHNTDVDGGLEADEWDALFDVSSADTSLACRGLAPAAWTAI